MERIFCDCIIYKINKYSDSSAVATAYASEYGKIKLFIPKAFSKKGGVYTFIPGEADFLKKYSSDLNKLYSFRPYPDFMEYASDPLISLRLSLLFDILDTFYELEQKDKAVWKVLVSYLHKNPGKVNIFGIYAILQNTGHMFNFNKCAGCGADISEAAAILDGLCYCNHCKPDNAFKIDEFINFVLKALSSPALYKNININLSKELEITDMFVKHIEFVSSKKLKSYSLFRRLITSL